MLTRGRRGSNPRTRRVAAWPLRSLAECVGSSRVLQGEGMAFLIGFDVDKARMQGGELHLTNKVETFNKQLVMTNQDVLLTVLLLILVCQLVYRFTNCGLQAKVWTIILITTTITTCARLLAGMAWSEAILENSE